jgi:hypothetical protein
VAFDASLGVNGHLYRPLHDYVFAYGALRVPARFAMLTVMFLSVLAGLGASMLLKRLARAPAQYAILGLILAALIAESLPRPLVLSELPTRIPPVYHWLKNMPAGPILEYPVGQLGGRVGPQDPTYMFYSTVHWRPLLNGYSGFAPLSYYELLAEMQNFPDPASLEYLRRRGARYLLVHQRFYMRPGFEADVAALDTAAAVRRVAEFRDGDRWATVVYEIRPSAGGRR